MVSPHHQADAVRRESGGIESESCPLGRPRTKVHWTDDEPKEKSTAIYPRRSPEDRDSAPRKDAVFVSKSALSQLFHLSLPDAAARLGISPTALKSACRKLGIEKWPYRRR
mmetsp:Transcript_5937/g.12021  ORF Transcript_5937/g.12021 Transcript_5937/m.12021 type:complete len:111 (+) Transcript_5937:2-334(+)